MQCVICDVFVFVACLCHVLTKSSRHFFNHDPYDVLPRNFVSYVDNSCLRLGCDSACSLNLPDCILH